jgi:Tfp pilus assembly protein PilN
VLKVNFISNRRTQQIRRRRIGESLIRAIGVIGLAMLAYTVLGVLSLRRMELAIEQTNLAKVAFQDQAAEVRRLRTAIGALQPRVDLVQQGNRRLDHWRYLYVQIARSTPDTVRVDSIDVGKGEGTDKTMQVIGTAKNAYSITKMMLALNQQPGFSDVAMGQVTMTTPERATMNARLTIRPLPEDVPPPPPPTQGPS